MSKDIPGNGKHLTLADRIEIHRRLDNNESISTIAKYLCKDPSTISREIKKHREIHYTRTGTLHNYCVHKKECNRRNVCGNKQCTRRCTSCNLCNKHCSDFVPNACKIRMSKPPYVCNGCDEKHKCRQNKYFYNAGIADNNSHTLKESCRKGFNLTDEEIIIINQIVSPLIMRGQSIHHIYFSHKHEIPCSERTLYRLIQNCQLDARNIDLQRTVRRKIRRVRKNTDPIHAKKARLNRDYQCFQKFLSENDTDVVEMDTVIGSKDSKRVLLTMLFRSSKLMLIFLMEDNTQESVREVFDYLETILGLETFQKTFPCFLTDNGSEFLNPDELEVSKEGELRTRIFYCEPNSPYQKGSIEKNHEYIRYIIPKGTPFDALTQKQINLVMNHINSTIRSTLSDHTPFEVAKLYMSDDTIVKLHLKSIPPDKVCLKPSLVK